MKREILEFDICIVGAGPAGLAAAIKLAQLKPDITVCVLEKGAYVGAHSISGAVLETASLSQLIPDWKERGAPISQQVTSDEFYLLSAKKSIKLPTPRPMRNKGNFIISLGELTSWLAKQAEEKSVQIFTGFAAQEAIIEDGMVKGVITAEMGIAKDGTRKENYQPGVEVRAKYTLFAEGARGHISESIIKEFSLRENGKFQTYALGIKEIWEIDNAKHPPGKTIHTIGWPLDARTYGGSFIYHKSNNQIALGLVVGLDYENPYLDPYEEFQRFKTHPFVAKIIQGGKRISYGARVLNEGGLQSLPTLSFPGGVLIGCAAGFLNVPKIKGIHNAIESGCLAAQSIVDAMQKGSKNTDFCDKIKSSNIYKELYKARNIRPYFRYGLYLGLVFSAIDTFFNGKLPFTIGHKQPDNLALKNKADSKRIIYPKPDGIRSFDRMASIYLSGTNHEENQPSHLIVKKPEIAISYNLAIYDAPEQRYCPAGVYEIHENKLRINAQNCVHCKACDVKDPTQNIRWVAPESGGPNYQGM